jgi:hypothetical protein
MHLPFPDWRGRVAFKGRRAAAPWRPGITMPGRTAEKAIQPQSTQSAPRKNPREDEGRRAAAPWRPGITMPGRTAEKAIQPQSPQRTKPEIGGTSMDEGPRRRTTDVLNPRDLIQKNKEDQFSFQWSVYSCQWSVISC